jgi:FKBP-type peptidyl-prolyl cis-trans isomerase FkpA
MEARAIEVVRFDTNQSDLNGCFVRKVSSNEFHLIHWNHFCIKKELRMLRSWVSSGVALFFALSTVIVTQAAVPEDGKEETTPRWTTGPEDRKELVKPGAIDKDAPMEFTTTKSGLKYRILRASKKNKPKADQGVEVHYKGWLDDKTVFDSSYRRGKRIKFMLNGVIPGWSEGLQLVGAGGMIELEIPAKLGYGLRGVPGVIPPNANLHFLVELHDIN